jgi:hypothetical protein
MEVLMSELPKTQHANLDGLVKKLNRFPNQHGYKMVFHVVFGWME